jgi:hypothetical protein
MRASRFKEIRAEVVIIQPGLSKTNMSEAQGTILSGAHSFLIDTVQIGLKIIGSA